MTQWYRAERLFDGMQLRDNVYFSVERGAFQQLTDNIGTQDFIALSGVVSSGFIDIQVNGGGGELFNATPTLPALKHILGSHNRFGTTSMLPTVITDEVEVMSKAASAVAQARAEGVTGIAGIHFEGPHLCPEKRGIHKAEFIRSVSDKELALYCRNDLGAVLVTLAPETVPVDVIRDLVHQGVVVSLGHSNADSDQVEAALEAGATGFTHLFNAMSPLQSRAPGMVGTALSDQSSYAGLIADFVHVHKDMCALAIRCKTDNHIVLVTDAMHHVGCDENSLPYYDIQIYREGDKLFLADGTIAGSALDMASSVRNVYRELAVPLESALGMATIAPASFMGLINRGKIQPGFQADFVVLNEALEVNQTWAAGRPIYSTQR